MNNSKQFFFETKALGKLRILSFIDNIALLEKMYDSKEIYIVAINFDIENCCWGSGLYRTSFQEAFEEFRKMVYLGKNINLQEKESDYDFDI